MCGVHSWSYVKIYAWMVVMILMNMMIWEYTYDLENVIRMVSDICKWGYMIRVYDNAWYDDGSEWLWVYCVWWMMQWYMW